MQDIEMRAVALGKKLRRAALEDGFGMNEAGFIAHEALLYILRDLPPPAPDDWKSESEIAHPAPSAWRGR